MTMIRQLRALLVSLFFLSLCSVGSAQSAQIQGQVSDSSGAVIPKAMVRIVNQLTGTERKAATNGSGQYDVPGLDPSVYKVFVQAPGFSTAVSTPVTLNVGQNAVLDFKLQVGSEAQSVTVDGSRAELNTSDGSVSTVIDRQFVENMPLNGRSFQDLIELTPGVVTQSPQAGAATGYSGEFSVNGQRTESNVYTVDGVNANTGGSSFAQASSGTSGSLPSATALGTTQSLVSIDDLQEFRVNSSSYSAEYGLSPGGQFSFQTRSGTNELHGTLFDYLRNGDLDANNWFNDYTSPITEKTGEQQNDFGGTFGGPILIPKLYDGRNKSFFFVSYEGLRLNQPTAAAASYVPTVALRQDAPAVLQPILNAFPIPNGPEVSTPCDNSTYACLMGDPVGTPVPSGLATFTQAYSLPSSLNSTSIRFDQQLSSKVKLFYRYADTPSRTESRVSQGLSVLQTASQRSHSNTLGLTSVFSSNISNDFRVNYTSSAGSDLYALTAFGGSTPVNLFQLQGLDTATNPSAYDDVAFFIGGYIPQIYETQTNQPQHAWDANDSTSISYGRQTLKFGVDYRRISSNITPISPEVIVAFDSSAGILSNVSEAGIVDSYSKSSPVYTNFAAYVQDELRVSRKINASFGLRWEVNPPPGTTSGPLPYVVEGDLDDPSSLALAPENAKFWKTTHYNFAPRLGVAYRAFDQPGRQTVIRAGAGVFFDSGQQDSTQPFGNSPGEAAEQYYFGASYPLTQAQLNVQIANPPSAPYNEEAYYFPTRLQLPYTLQWNLSVEQELGKTQSLTMSYVGSNGRRLLSEQYFTPSSGNFDIDGLVLEKSGTTSSYNALQVKFQRTLSRGLQVLASYTWAHAIDFGSQNLDFAQIRGNSDYDLRNNFNAAATYNFPILHSNGLVNGFVNHWSLDMRYLARGAFPVILDGNEITLPNGAIAYQGLNLVPNEPVYLHTHGLPGNREINPAAFALPASTAYGNAPRNFVRGFGVDQLDTAIQRVFPVVGRLKLQFRAEAFNVLNHPDFGYVYPYYGGVQFGQATETLNESLGTLSPIYQQGGPRSLQIALKLLF
jgi:hypothetical protein